VQFPTEVEITDARIAPSLAAAADATSANSILGELMAVARPPRFRTSSYPIRALEVVDVRTQPWGPTASGEHHGEVDLDKPQVASVDVAERSWEGPKTGATHAFGAIDATCASPSVPI
jgi:hypothetical protein